ncbi:unnamed protein product, partial [Owenia fusiformis]
ISKTLGKIRNHVAAEIMYIKTAFLMALGVAIIRAQTEPAPTDKGEIIESCDKDVFLDVLIMLDHSQSISKENIVIVRDAMKALVEQFVNVGNSNRTVKVALITYNKNVTTELLFNQSASSTKAGTLAAIENMSMIRQRRSRVDLAFDYANEVVFTPGGGDRPLAQNVLIHVTDGRILKAKIQAKTLKAGGALNAREDKVNVVLLYIPSTLPTSDDDKPKLDNDRPRVIERKIPDEPKDRHFRSFKDINNMLPSIPDIARRICAMTR